MSRCPDPRQGRPGAVRALTALLIALPVAWSPARLGAQAQAVQHDHPETASARVEPETPLLTAVLGPYSRKITTSSPLAQAYFDQGMQMVFAFTHSVGIPSFQEAQRQDPTCAMCYWGEALARGPFLNSVMGPANAGPAYAAAQKALSLVNDQNTPLERELIRAMAVRYVENHEPARRAPLDSAYSRAMEGIYRQNGDDTDVGTLYAESIMLLNTNRGQYRLADPFVQSFHRVLEAVLARDIEHPWACHLYVHGTEGTEAPNKAEACANFLGRTIPGASHINHMPSHTFNRIGRWDSAVRANLQAWQSDRRTEFGEGVSYAATHNLHMLLFAGSMGGQGAVAAGAAHEYAVQVNGGVFYEALVHHRFGNFDDVLALTQGPTQPIQKGLWEFARGYAHLRKGAVDSARAYLARVDEAAANTPANTAFRGHTAAQLLGITGDILRGELLREEGKLAEAITAFERAAERQDGLRYDEPEPLNFAARHWLGAALLEAGRAADAQRVYEVSLEKHPHNGWSLFGLEQALRAQNKTAEADQVRDRFRTEWERADVTLRSSRF
jgi:tetratricopeptide (TPR) repeat protein